MGRGYPRFLRHSTASRSLSPLELGGGSGKRCNKHKSGDFLPHRTLMEKTIAWPASQILLAFYALHLIEFSAKRLRHSSWLHDRTCPNIGFPQHSSELTSVRQRLELLISAHASVHDRNSQPAAIHTSSCSSVCPAVWLQLIPVTNQSTNQPSPNQSIKTPYVASQPMSLKQRLDQDQKLYEIRP